MDDSAQGSDLTTSRVSQSLSVDREVLQRQKEINDMNEARIHTMEAIIKRLEQELEEEKKNAKALQEDFKYNLALFDERDIELQKYDAQFIILKRQLREKDTVISDLTAKCAEAENKVKEEAAHHDEIEIYYQEKIQELKKDIETVSFNAEEKLRVQKDEYEALVRDLRRQLRDKDEDIAAIRREVENQFDEAIREREKQWTQRESELLHEAQKANNKLSEMQHDTTIKTLQQKDTENRIQTLTQRLHETETQLRRITEESEDKIRSKDVKLIEAEQINSQLNERLESLLREHETKMRLFTEDNQTLKRTIEKQRRDFEELTYTQKSTWESHQTELIKTYDAQIKKLVDQLKEAVSELDKIKRGEKNHIWETEDKLRQREEELEKVKLELEEQLRKKERQLDDAKSKIWSLEMEMVATRDKNEKLKKAIDERRSEITALKKEISDGAERENDLKRQLLQEQLKGENVIDEKERMFAAEHDEILSTLKAQRDESNAMLQEKREQLEQMQIQLKAAQLQIEKLTRNVDRKADNGNRQSNDNNTDFSSLKTPSPMPSPQASWGNLDQLLKGARFPSMDAMSTNSPAPNNAERNTALESENERLRHRTAELESQNEKIRAVIKQMRQEMESLQSSMNNNNAVEISKDERNQYAEQINTLKQYTDFLMKKNEELSRGFVDKSSDREEVLILRTSFRNLNNLLTKVREDFVAAQQDIAKLKLELAAAMSKQADGESGGAGNNFQSQLTQLRNEMKAQNDKLTRSDENVGEIQKENKHLRVKLREAAKDLKRLMKEREKLMDISNMLKADLNRLQGNPSHNNAMSPVFQMMTPSASTGVQQQQQQPGFHTPLFSGANSREEEIIQRYESKLATLEESMKVLMDNNKSLKKELYKWTNERDDENTRHTTTAPRSASTSRRRAQSPPRDNLAGSTGSMFDGLSLEDVHMRAKQKLEDLRSSLTLAGSKMTSTRASTENVTQSARMTDSQRKSLQQIQKNKAELVPQRKAVRDKF